MKRKTKKITLSTLVATMAATLTAAAALGVSATYDANAATVDTTRFEMVDGASIRMAQPLGLRFIAELGSATYEDLMTSEDGVEKKMGMFIMPYTYLSDASMYSDGATGVSNENYQNITTKIDNVFYDSADATVENKIYSKGDYYYANGVISNLYLHNFDTQFVGIAYIAETVTATNTTTYTFADFNAEDNVRSAAYVAIRAYEDYTAAECREIFNEYVWGAHLHQEGLLSQNVETNTDGSRKYTYTYGGATYNDITSAAENAGVEWSLEVDRSAAYVLNTGDELALSETITDSGNSLEAGFTDAGAVWSSSDESIATVDKWGNVTTKGKGSATITANFMGTSTSCELIVEALTFDTMTSVPTYLSNKSSRIETFAIADDTAKDGKALKATTTSASTSDVGVLITTAMLDLFFEDEDVDYMAFDLMTGGTSRTGTAVYYYVATSSTGGSATKYESGHQYTAIRNDSYKTYYFPRSAYESWVNNGVSQLRFLLIGGGLVYGGESFYIDNLRGATAEEYEYSYFNFENGDLRTNNGATILYFGPTSSSGWDLSISNVTLDSSNAPIAGFTNSNVSDGGRALWFTKNSGTTTFGLNGNLADTDEDGAGDTEFCTVMEEKIRAAGYISFDLYVPAGSDAYLPTTADNGASRKTALEAGKWTTVYLPVSSDLTSDKLLDLTDTTGGTYAIDNIRLLTAEEYQAAGLSFESNVGELRLTDISNGTAYYYGKYVVDSASDVSGGHYGPTIVSGAGRVTEVRYDSEIVHGGDYSLAFVKAAAGEVKMQMRKDSASYALLKNGFTFWVYSTVAINGNAKAKNFVDGNGNYFVEGGMTLPANKWTQITVDASDIYDTNASSTEAAAVFLKTAGSWTGTMYFDDFEPLPAKESLIYKATVESDNADDATAVRSGITLAASTHTNSNQDALPQDTTDTEDMSYIKFNGSYGLNDFLVFDFTGDNVPIMSFFNSEVTNTIYNQAEDANVKGWIVTNGMTTPVRGLTYGGLAGAHANRLAMIGPYKISYRFDDNGSGTALTQGRLNEGTAASPSPISMAALQSVTNPYRMIVGWTKYSDTNMALNIVVLDLTTGQKVANYNGTYATMRAYSLADWEGDIALYGHFGRTTTVDALYPIEEDTTMDEVVAKYMPSTVVYNGAWDENGGLTLNASTFTGGTANMPTGEDMSYIAFNGSYGLGDYLVFDFTGDNLPYISFFTDTVTNTVYNVDGTTDDSERGWVIANGLRKNDGNLWSSGTHSQRLAIIGNHKIVQYDGNTNDFRVCYYGNGTSSVAANGVCPIGIESLVEVTDTYRMIIGFDSSVTSKTELEIYVLNMITGEVVWDMECSISTTNRQEGSIALHGRFGDPTVLDKVIGVVENTTMAEVIAAYGKDTDYSDEKAVTLDRYAYSSLSDGQWTLDGTDQVTNPTDYRTLESTYTTYEKAGFNILLAQDMIGTDGTKATWEASANKTYMDNAYNAGLKVILTDWHLQILSAPIKVTTSGAAASDSTYVPWIIGTDASATTGAAADYLGYLNSLGITVDSTRFATRDALDKFIYDQLAPYKDHPAFYGVMLADEPSYHNAYCYGEVYKSIKRVMPDCYVQYNLLPMEHSFGTIQYRYPGVNDIGENITNAQIEEAYRSYVESYLDTMGTDYVQYDDYPFKSAEEGILFGTSEEPYVDPTSLRNIQIIAEIAKERGLNVKVVSQSSVMKSGGSDGPVHIRQVTENDARWLNNYLMGFGVKQINYFTYWTKRASTSDGEYFVDGGSFVNRDGTPTALYTFMQTIMADNDKFAPTISHFDYNDSQIFGSDNDSDLNNEHISWSSSLTAAASFKWLTSVTTSLEYTLVTELYDSDNYNYMYMVMNTIDPNYGGTQSVTVTLDSSITSFYVYDQSGNRTLVTGNSYSGSLTAGQAVYILPCAWSVE